LAATIITTTIVKLLLDPLSIPASSFVSAEEGELFFFKGIFDAGDGDGDESPPAAGHANDEDETT
jgi:hypothetical protein